MLLLYMSEAFPRLTITEKTRFENVPVEATLMYLRYVPVSAMRSAVCPVVEVNVIWSAKLELSAES